MNASGLHAMVLVSDWDESGAEKAIRSAGRSATTLSRCRYSIRGRPILNARVNCCGSTD